VTGSARRSPSVTRTLLALLVLAVLAFASLLAACSSPAVSPTGAVDLSFPDDTFPPDLSLGPDDSLGPNDSLQPGDSPGPDDSLTPSGAFSHGTATITFSSGTPKTVVLPHLAADSASTFEADLGVSVTWRGGDWAIHLDAAVPPDPVVLTMLISREDTDPPLSADGSTCTVTFTSETIDHVAGKAECKGIVWNNAFGADGMDLPVPTPVPGSSSAASTPFDATITFSATP
jgi:hypothetical protein